MTFRLLSFRTRPGIGLRFAAILVVLALVAACSPEQSSLSISPNSLPDGRVGQAYDQQITVRNNTTPLLSLNVQNGFLPSGLRLQVNAGSDNTGHIFGTPLVAGTFRFEIFAQCVGSNVSGQTGTQAYTLTVQ